MSEIIATFASFDIAKRAVDQLVTLMTVILTALALIERVVHAIFTIHKITATIASRILKVFFPRGVMAFFTYCYVTALTHMKTTILVT